MKTGTKVFEKKNRNFGKTQETRKVFQVNMTPLAACWCLAGAPWKKLSLGVATGAKKKKASY